MSKFDIKKSGSLPSDEEINKYKNFDKVVKKAAMYDYKKVTKPIYKNVKILSAVAVIVSVGLIFLFETYEQDDETSKQIKQTDTTAIQKTIPVKDSVRPIKPVSTVTANTENTTTTTATSVATETQTTSPSTTALQNTSTSINTLAEFPGGDEALKKFLSDNIKYPYNAVETPYSGKVEVEITIEKTGEIGNITIYNSPNVAISNEIKRVIKKMPKWKTAYKNSEAVASMVTVYFPFKYVEY